MEITFADVEEFVKNRKVWPSQLFDIKKVYEDNEFKEVLKTKFATPEKIKNLEDQIAEMSKKLAVYEKKEGRSKGRDLLVDKLRENTTDAQKEHLLRAWEKSTQSDFSDSAIDKFIAEEKKEYEYIVERFGTPKDKTSGVGKTEEEKNASTKAAKEAENLEVEDLAAALMGN